MKIVDQFNIVINNSLQENKTDPCMHLIEEMAELTVELCKEKRGRDHNFNQELSHVFFQLNKVIIEDGLTIESVMEACLKETKERFPNQLKIN